MQFIFIKKIVCNRPLYYPSNHMAKALVSAVGGKALEQARIDVLLEAKIPIKVIDETKV